MPLGGYVGEAPLSGTDDFAQFFAGTYPRLAGFAASLVRDQDLGHEIAQDAMVAAYSRWMFVRHPQAYVFRVVSHQAAKERRRQATIAQDATVVPSPPPESEISYEVVDVLLRLPERLRTVAVLHYVLDMSIAEIAQAVTRPVGTVKRRLMEARALLRDAFEVGDNDAPV